MFPSSRLFLTLLLGAAASSLLHAQTNGWNILAIENGLSQGTVNALVQDRQGYLWVGTEDGLNRFDGYEFRIYQPSPEDSLSLPDGFVTALCVDRAGVLWVGTKGGVRVYDPRRGGFVLVPGGVRAVNEGECTALALDSTGTIWCGMVDGLYACVPGPAPQVVSHGAFLKLPGLGVRCLCVDHANRLWISTRRLGMVQIVDPSRRAEQVVRVPSPQEIWAFGEVHRGEMLLGSYSDGVYRCAASGGDLRRGGQWGAFPWPRAGVWSILEDRAGGVWLGTGGDGLYHLDPDGGRVRRSTFRDNYLLALLQDRSGVLWAGTGKGLQRRSVHLKGFVSIMPAEGKDGDVWSVGEGKNGSLWVGTNYGVGVARAGERIQPVSGVTSTVVRSLVVDHTNDLWVGTLSDGLLHRTPDGVLTRIPMNPGNRPVGTDDEVRCLMRAANGTLWAGASTQGVVRVDPQTGSVHRYPLPGPLLPGSSASMVLALAEDEDGKIWVGTGGQGLYCLDPVSGTYVANHAGDLQRRTLATNRIYALHAWPRGTLWLGTAMGLWRVDRGTGSLERFTTREGLPNDVIYSLRHDMLGFLWMSTNHGLARLDPQRKIFRTFDAQDGLPSNEFNGGASGQGSDGALFFGGVNGAAVIHPLTLRDDSLPPAVVLTRFHVQDRDLDAAFLADSNRMVELQYAASAFSVEFSALAFASPEKNQYAYKLEGFDPDWIECGTRRYAAYTNLPGGSYTLRIRGSNNDGVWNMTGTSVAIRVVPPFWRTAWFFVLAAVVVVGTVSLLVLVRFRRLKADAALQARISERILSSQEEERKRIGASLHDSLGQNLLLIKNLAAMAGTHGQGGEKWGEISTLASQALAEVREISYDLRPYQLDRLGLTGAIRSVGTRMASSSGFTLTMDLDNIDGLIPKEQEINLFRIVQEALNNIVKHAQATEVAITLRRQTRLFVLTVADNGMGMMQRTAGFGMTSMAERARILGGSLSVQPMERGGTAVTAQIPITQDQA